MSDIKSAIDRMNKIMANWFTEDPMLLNTWCLVEKVADKSQKTIGIDTRSSPPQIRYNPNFVNSVSYEQFEMVMASECFKLMLKHPTTRLQDPKEATALGSTISVDELMKKDFEKIPGMKDMALFAKDFGFPEKSYMEDYRRRLLENQQKVEKILQNMFGQSNKECQEKNGQNDSDQDDGECENKDEQNGSGDFQEFDNSSEAIKEYMNPNSTNTKDWGSNDFLDAEIQNMVNNMKGSSQMWGKFTGDAISQIVAANTPKISYKEILRRFNTSVQTSLQYMTRMKPNRRFDLEAQGRRRKNTTKVLFAIDSSGSMSDQDLAEGFAVVNSVCRHAKVDYMLWDTEIKCVESNFKKARKSFKVLGRGGTSPEKVLKYAEEHQYDGLIVYSDMFFDDNFRQPKRPKVLWLGTNKSSKNPVGWGYFAVLDRNE